MLFGVNCPMRFHYGASWDESLPPQKKMKGDLKWKLKKFVNIAGFFAKRQETVYWFLVEKLKKMTLVIIG